MVDQPLENDPLWYKDAIIYELHVRAFHDSNDDGIGDFKGLIQKLDYLDELGVTAIWLLPFYPSPLKDDGYDIADYQKIHPQYGALKDFKDFLAEAHKRGIRVITELVLNHTSSDHKWFQEARRAKPGSVKRDRYVWNSTPDKYNDARIIFQDFETSNWTWDSVAGAYYWHRFYAHQPDLNFENLFVQKEMQRVLDYWLGLGVDGLRLDAVPYLFEREGTNCENLPETHQFLKKMRAHVDKMFNNKMFLAEANQWPEDAAAYFGSGDECHMAFHFPIMPRLFMAVQMEDSYPIIDILKATPPIADLCQWATFLRNHDELTLEMVTDEERDYMYRLYAKDPRAKINVGIRRRLAPLLNNNRKKIELLNILLFSLPGTPVIYYGDEIGMGDNYYLGDRNGVRTPMQWSGDRNAGFSRANPHQLYLPVIIDPDYHFEAINVENQSRNLSSLLWWMKRVIAMRKKIKAFGRGSFSFIPSDNNKVITFIRSYNDEHVVVVVNLSRFSQVVHLDLEQFQGYVPQEAFSQNDFPIIRKKPYFLTLGPYNHFWLVLTKKKRRIETSKKDIIPAVTIKSDWSALFRGANKVKLESDALPQYIQKCRWFASKARKVRRLKIIESTPLHVKLKTRLLIVEVQFYEGIPENYFLPVSFIPNDELKEADIDNHHKIILEMTIGDEKGALCDSMHSEEFRRTLLLTIGGKKKIKGLDGDFVGFTPNKMKDFLDDSGKLFASRPLKAEQSNTSILFDKKFMLKLYRKVDEGANPEYEIMRAVAEDTSFKHMPSFSGALEYRRNKGPISTVALLETYVENTGDAWTFTKESVINYFDHILTKREDEVVLPESYPSIYELGDASIPDQSRVLIGSVYLEMVGILGKRTAELHTALSSIVFRKEFAPEPFSLLYQRSVYQSIQALLSKNITLLRKNIKKIPVEFQEDAQKVIAGEGQLVHKLQKLLERKISGMKIRIHGDYHLGQVLCTGKDFTILDFEGEPARSLGERKLKHSALKDVAGLLRSFHYAAYAGIFLRPAIRLSDIQRLEKWVTPWYRYVSGVFLESYFKETNNAAFLPKLKEEITMLLEIYLLEKAIYELGYELNNRPEWIVIPLRGIERILNEKDN